MTAEPIGTTEAVFACLPGCGALVVDRGIHAKVCPARDGAPEATTPPLGPQIVEWLDTLDAEELEWQAFDESDFDTNGTVAVLERLKRLAAAL